MGGVFVGVKCSVVLIMMTNFIIKFSNSCVYTGFTVITMLESLFVCKFDMDMLSQSLYDYNTPSEVIR